MGFFLFFFSIQGNNWEFCQGWASLPAFHPARSLTPVVYLDVLKMLRQYEASKFFSYFLVNFRSLSHFFLFSGSVKISVEKENQNYSELIKYFYLLKIFWWRVCSFLSISDKTIGISGNLFFENIFLFLFLN